MKNILSLLLLLVVVNVEASLIPEPPSSCFKSKSRCSSVKIVKRAGVKRVAIDLFARVSKEKFGSVDEISQRYLAFENCQSMFVALEVLSLELPEHLRFLVSLQLTTLIIKSKPHGE